MGGHGTGNTIVSEAQEQSVRRAYDAFNARDIASRRSD
jgi:hypothetical protein